jgi:hypothetical protein
MCDECIAHTLAPDLGRVGAAVTPSLQGAGAAPGLGEQLRGLISNQRFVTTRARSRWGQLYCLGPKIRISVPLGCTGARTTTAHSTGSNWGLPVPVACIGGLPNHASLDWTNRPGPPSSFCRGGTKVQRMLLLHASTPCISRAEGHSPSSRHKSPATCCQVNPSHVSMTPAPVCRHHPLPPLPRSPTNSMLRLGFATHESQCHTQAPHAQPAPLCQPPTHCCVLDGDDAANPQPPCMYKARGVGWAPLGLAVPKSQSVSQESPNAAPLQRPNSTHTLLSTPQAVRQQTFEAACHSSHPSSQRGLHRSPQNIRLSSSSADSMRSGPLHTCFLQLWQVTRCP